MNLESLKYFNDVVELKSISKVAKNSHISQPALSHQLFKLENEFNLQLLERSNKGVEITERGEVVYNYSKKILALYEELHKELNKNEKEKRELRVTNTSPYINYIFSAIAGGIGSIFNKYNVEMNKNLISGGHILLINEKSDIIIGSEQLNDEDLKSEFAGKDELVLVSKTKIDNLEQMKVGILDYKHCKKFEEYIDKNNLNIALKSNSITIIMGFLEGKDTCAILPRIEIQKKINDGEMFIERLEECYYNLYISYRKNIDKNIEERINGLKERIDILLK
ncbi:MAG: LysR family transcriptional regulator [Clostridium sp.]